MAEESAIETFEIKGLDQILKALKMAPPVCRVGILGEKDSRSGNQHSNATVGAAHEFGTTKISQRSFLRIPITENLNKQLESSGALDKDTLSNVIKMGDVKPWLKKIGIEAEKVVQDAFDTGGSGKWPAHARGYTNNTGMLLVDSTQLRNSITSEVK